MIVHRRWTIIKKQHPSKTCRFHGMQFFNGPYGAIKKHFELAKLCFVFEQFFALTRRKRILWKPHRWFFAHL